METTTNSKTPPKLPPFLYLLQNYHHHQNLFNFSLYIFISFYGASRASMDSGPFGFSVIQASVLAVLLPSVFAFLLLSYFYRRLGECSHYLLDFTISLIMRVFSLSSYFFDYASSLAFSRLYLSSRSISISLHISISCLYVFYRFYIMRGRPFVVVGLWVTSMLPLVIISDLLVSCFLLTHVYHLTSSVLSPSCHAIT